MTASKSGTRVIATRQLGKAFHEAAGLLRAPHRAPSLFSKILSDSMRSAFEPRHLYSYTKTIHPSDAILNLLVGWILDGQRPDGGIPAYYSYFTGYSASYPEVTGYIIPTLYDFAAIMPRSAAALAAQRATDWLLSLQTPIGAFPGGLHGHAAQPSVFNTGQILHGLVRAHAESSDPAILRSAIAAADWLISIQHPTGFWSGPGAYQDSPHTYYTMVAWALASLSHSYGDPRYSRAAEKNLDWALAHFRPNGWIDGINLQGHPAYLHFIAYVLQGALESAVLCGRNDAVEAVAGSAWTLLRKFETRKFLPGAFSGNFKTGSNFACLTGNAQISCVWLRLFEIIGDLRYLNAALKMNEMMKASVPQRGRKGIIGGVAGSYPIWGRYQPFRYISWGCKFFGDALISERRILRSLDSVSSEALLCAS